MAKYTCPECGAPFWSFGHQEQPPAPAPGGWTPVQRRTVGFGAVPADTVAYERIAPAQRPTSHHFLVPFAQSLATSAAALFVGIVLSVMFSWPWWSPLAIAALAFGWSWALLLRYYNSLLQTREVMEPRQEQDQPAGRQVTRLAVTMGEVHQEREVPIAPDKLLAIAKGVVNAKRRFSEREFAGRGRVLSGRSEFEQLRDTFMSFGWLRWKDDAQRKQGTEWTPAGRAALQALASGRVKPERLL